MPKYLLFIVLFLFISCNYQKPQKDKYPEMLTFSEVASNPEKLNLKLFSGKNEDIEAIFITENKCITVSYVSKDNNAASSDSIVISDYTSLKNCKKYYFKINQSNNDSIKNEADPQPKNINLYGTEMIDDVIYTLNHKFSPPDYNPQLLDPKFWKNRGDELKVYNIASTYNEEDVLEPFESIVIRNTTLCGGGRLGGSIICPVYLDYFKISSLKKTVYFKEVSSYNNFKILNIFGENCLLYLPGINKNTSLFIINQ